MSCVYRYIDVEDNVIKYVGIVWSSNSSLEKRVKQHLTDYWYPKHVWKIEYLDYPIESRTDAEYIESHFIALYQTNKYYNRSKAGWGVSSFIPDVEKQWKQFISRKSIVEKQKERIAELEKQVSILSEKLTIANNTSIKTITEYVPLLPSKIDYDSNCLTISDCSSRPTFNEDEIIKLYYSYHVDGTGFTSIAKLPYVGTTFISEVGMHDKKLLLSTYIINQNGERRTVREDVVLFDYHSNKKSYTPLVFPSEYTFAPINLTIYRIAIKQLNDEKTHYQYLQRVIPICHIERAEENQWYVLVGTEKSFEFKIDKGNKTVLVEDESEDWHEVPIELFKIKYQGFSMKPNRNYRQEIDAIQKRIDEIKEWIHSNPKSA